MYTKMKQLTILLIWLLAGSFSAYSQTLSGTYTIPGSYSSIENAVQALNQNGVSGAVVFNIGAGTAYSESPLGSIVLGSAVLNASVSASNTITFRRAATATANPLINAYAGTKIASSADSIDVMFAIAGTDYVTIDGIDLAESAANTSNISCMEVGYGLYKFSINDGANNNTIRNCTITLNRLNVTNGAGIRNNIAGSTGIEVVSSLRTTVNTALIQTAVSGANSFNRFYSNTIQNVNFGIALSGSAVAAPYTLADFNNDIGGSSDSTGNTIINFGGGVGAGFACGAVFINNEYNTNISYNMINNNTGTGVNHPVSNRGIWLFGSSPGASCSVNNNTITIKSGTNAGAINWCIDMEMAQSGANGNVLNINNNKLLNCVSAANTSVQFTAIWVNSAATTVNVNGNYIYGYTRNATTGIGTVILSQLAGIGTLNINNNVIDSMVLTGIFTTQYGIGVTAAATNLNMNGNSLTRLIYNNTTTGAGTFYPIYSTGTPAVVNANNNIIDSLVRAGTTGGTTIGLYIASGTTQNVKNNRISNMTITGSGVSSVMYGIQTSGTTVVCDSNTIFNLSVAKATGTGALYGIYNISSPNNENYRYNKIYNLNHIGTGIIYGIYAFTSAGVRTVAYNNIYQLTGNSTISGIQMQSSVPAIFNNRIYDLTSNNASNTLLCGINISTTTAGNARIFNNLIGRLFAPLSNNTTPTVIGINIPATTATASFGVYHNTVVINATSTGANFATAALQHAANATSTTAALDLRNNILVNTSVSNGVGNTVVIRRTAAALNNYAATSNRNLLFAGAPSASRLIYFDGFVGDSTIESFKLRLATFEQSSVSELPTFIDTLGANPNFLHLDTTISTKCESGGSVIPGITFDADGVIRQGNPGYAGTGGAPDIGADEGEFIGTVMVLDSVNVDQISAAVPLNTTNQAIVAVRVHVTNSFAPLNVSSFKLSTSGTTSINDIQNAKVFYTGNNPTFNTNTQFGSSIAAPNGTFYITGNRMLADGVNHFWVTYDIKTTATINNVVDVRVDSIVVGGNNTAPINGNPAGSRRILGPLNGTYLVGVGQAYPTITAAANDLSTLGVSGPVTFLLADNTYNTTSGEVFPISFTAYTGASSTNTVTIKPNTAVNASITANNGVAAIFMNGINHLRIDGRPVGASGFTTGNNLVISNTNANGPAVLLNNEASNNQLLYTEFRSNNAIVPGAIGAGVICFGASVGSNGNDNNSIKFCDIHELTGGNPNIAISSIGSAASILANNDGNSIDSCNIYNFFNPINATSGIYLGANNSAWIINANRLYQTVSVTTTGGQTHRAIWVTPNVASLTSASGFIITNNFIGGAAANGTGVYTMTGATGYQFFGMDISVGLGATTLVQNNTITNFSFTSGFAGNGTYGINIANGNVNIFGNLIGSTTTNGAFTFTTTVANGSFIALRSGGGTNINFSNNIVSGIDLISNNATLFAGFNGIAASGGTNITIHNNTVGSKTLLNSINGVSTSSTATGACAFRGIICNSLAVAAVNTVTNNTVANMNLNYAATGTQGTTLIGIAITSGSSVVSGNEISNLTSATQTTAGVPTAAIAGIAYTSTTAPATIVNNSIGSLVLTGSSTTASVQAVGISYGGPSSGTNTIGSNSVHSISINANNPSAFITGFDVSGGIANVQNNMIRLGYDSLGGDVTAPATFRGITKFAGSFNFYFNSIFIGGTGVFAGTANTFAFARNSAGTEIVRNNIFVNNRSNGAGTAKHYQVFLANATTLTINNNLYFGNGTGSVFGTLNNGASDVAAYTPNWVATDNASAAANPQFVNATGSATSGDLHINPTFATPIEASGAAITTITNDFDGQTRTSLTPTDIGADAGNFISLDVRAPIIASFSLGNTASTGDRTFNVSITDQTGIPMASGLAPRVYFSKSATGTFSSTAATRITGNAQDGMYSFTISAATMGGLSLNDSVYAFVIAQDSSANNYISSFPAGANASNVSTIITPPITLLGYKIVPGFIGNINVGVGQTYTSLTDAGGLFEAINNGAINGNVTALITSDLLESGLVGLNPINQLGSFTLTIAPSDSVERLIAGSFAGGLIRLNGADRVKMDGRFNGNGKYLRFRNRLQNGFTLNLINDAQQDTITHCIFESVNNTVGTITFGGTNVVGGTGNSNNAILHCVIRDTLGTLPANNIPNTGFFSQGTVGSNNDNNTLAFNEVLNFGFNGVNLSTTAGDFWNITNNSFYQTIVKANVLTVLQIDGGTGHTINANSIGGSSANRSGAAFTTTSTTNPNVIAVRINNALTTAQVSNNSISNIASSSAVNLITISAGNITISNNTIGGGAMPYDTIQNGFDNGIINITGGTVSIANNTIGNISYYDGFGDRTSGITVTGGTVNIVGNTIRDIKGNSSGTAFTFLITGMHISGGVNHIIERNTIFNIQNTNTGSSAYTTAGINITSGTNLFVQRNRIHSIFGNGIGAGASSNQVFGIYTAAIGGITFRNNQIAMGNLTSGETRVYGIQDVANSGVNNYFYNSILLSGQVTGGSNNSYCLQRTGLVDVNVFNNIFYNNRRTLGNGIAFGMGANTLTGITPAANNYNLFIVNDTTRVVEGPLGFSNSISAFNTLYTSVNTYSSSWYALSNQVPVQTFFVDSIIGNLNIVNTHENAWYANGKGLPLANQLVDFNNNSRSVSILGGATDIGSNEFATSVLPPLATANAAPAANTTTTYTFGARQVASVQWGSTGTLPTDLAVRYYSGVNPPSTLPASTFFNAYHQITATGGTGFTYQLNLLADSAIRGSVANMNVANMARLNTNWQLISGSATQGNAARLFTTVAQNSFGIFTGTQGNNNPLPVTYLSIDAKSTSGNVYLDWKTASEQMNKGFYVERSVNGENFYTIGFVKGNGNSSRVNTYQWIDLNAFELNGVNELHYRLRQVDIDGMESYSIIKSVGNKELLENSISLYPNPFTELTTVQIVSKEAIQATIQIIDVNGRLISQQTRNLQVGEQTILLDDLQKNQAGIYFIKVNTQHKTEVIKAIKQ
jgi:hypothetical protein